MLDVYHILRVEIEDVLFELDYYITLRRTIDHDCLKTLTPALMLSSDLGDTISICPLPQIGTHVTVSSTTSVFAPTPIPTSNLCARHRHHIFIRASPIIHKRLGIIMLLTWTLEQVSTTPISTPSVLPVVTARDWWSNVVISTSSLILCKICVALVCIYQLDQGMSVIAL